MVFLTEQFVGQHVELLLVQASLGDGGELPAENLRQLTPLRRRGREEELQVLRMRRGKGETNVYQYICNKSTYRRTADPVRVSSPWARW